MWSMWVSMWWGVEGEGEDMDSSVSNSRQDPFPALCIYLSPVAIDEKKTGHLNGISMSIAKLK